MRSPPEDFGVVDLRALLLEASNEFVRLADMAAADEAAYEEIRLELMKRDGRRDMVTKASGSQSTKTTSTGGQNKPQAGGAAGAGKARGGAALPSTAKTTTAQGGRKGK